MRYTTVLLALAVGLAFTAAPALGADATVEGECKDSASSGGGGSVSADDGGNVDAADQSEAESIAAGLQDLDGGSCDSSAVLRATVNAGGQHVSVGYSDLPLP